MSVTLLPRGTGGIGRQVHHAVRAVRDFGLTHGTDFYYRYFFGRELPFAAELERRVLSWEKGSRGDVPLAEIEWEEQYRAGRWAMLENLRELSRYSVLAGYVQVCYPSAAVLDVGCGEGLLALRLHGLYRRYVGTDISAVAIEHALERAGGPQTEFLHVDGNDWVPSDRFDIIIFNESLYYFEHPFDAFRRYAAALAPGGAIAVSMFRGSRRARAIVRQLARDYLVRDRTVIKNGPLSWECCLFDPSRAIHNS